MKYDIKITSLLILLFSVTLILTSCGSNEKKEEVTYERLTPDQNISNVVINGDISNYVSIFLYILPEYEIVPVCQEEFDRILGSFEILNEKEILLMNELSCESNVENNSLVSLAKYNGISYVVAFYEGNDLSVSDKEGEEKCFSGAIMKTKNKTYKLQVTVFGEEVENSVYEGEYCPDKEEFDNEQMQFSNYIYDSFLQIKK